MRARITIDVDYNLNGGGETLAKELLSMLESVPENAAAEGDFTGDTKATVKEWSYKVERRPT